MTRPAYPPDVATELAELRRQVQDLQRASGRYVPALGGLADVSGTPSADNQVLTYNRATGRWGPGSHKVIPYLTRAPSTVALTTSYQTIVTMPSFNTINPNTLFIIDIVCDFQVTGAGALISTARALVGGTAPDASEAIFSDDAGRATVGQHYAYLVANPSGPHVIELQARKLNTAGGVNAMAIHTSLKVLVIG